MEGEVVGRRCVASRSTHNAAAQFASIGRSVRMLFVRNWFFSFSLRLASPRLALVSPRLGLASPRLVSPRVASPRIALLLFSSFLFFSFFFSSLLFSYLLILFRFAPLSSFSCACIHGATLRNVNGEKCISFIGDNSILRRKFEENASFLLPSFHRVF